MTQHSPTVRLQHMLDAAQKAVRLMQGRNRSDLDKDETLQLAITRLLEILGEAASQVPSSIKEEIPDLPWKEMVGVRNHLIHGYFDVDLDIVWQIISVDLPPLIRNVKTLLKI